MEILTLKNGEVKGKPANLEECQGYKCSDCFFRWFWNDSETVCLAFFLRLSDREPALIL
jgi:hypothetical protein